MKVTVGKYLAKKLEMLGIKDVFGLPGDYNFNILDSIIESKNLNWINCTNELNASYAADGYARINGYGALVTTYGVGELSAINGIAGSYAENLPVIHIIGVPKTSFIKNNVIVHHNFTKANYFAFKKAFENVTAAQTYLNFENAKSEINRVFDIAVNTKMPVYIAIPADVCEYEIDDEGFDSFQKNTSNTKNLNLAVEKIITLIKNSKNPLFLADFLVKRFNLKNETQKIAKYLKSGTFLMAKGILDETNPNYIGTYTGNLSAETTLKTVEKSDLIITAGFLYADLNTGGFSTFEHGDIEINKTETIILKEKFENVLIQDVIKLLAEKIQVLPVLNENLPPCACKNSVTPADLTQNIKVEEILSEIQTIFEANDIFVMETGLLSLSGGFINLKPDMDYLCQTLWGSIGWATPAAFGAMMAEKNRNLILFTGDGAHQLTAQELANFFEQDLHPVIFVLNNKGYTIERILSKNPDDKYNDITNWDYSKLLQVFSNGADYYYQKIRTANQCRAVLNKIKQIKGKKLCYVEIFTDKTDITKISRRHVLNMKNFNRRQSLQ